METALLFFTFRVGEFDAIDSRFLVDEFQRWERPCSDLHGYG
jgi:hypothetical protein